MPLPALSSPLIAAQASPGLTLLEMLVTIAIAAILTGLAGPSLQQLHSRWKLQQTSQALYASLMLARSEAIRRGGMVGIQRLSENEVGCGSLLSQRDWSCGWQIFIDLNQDGGWQPEEQVLQEVALSGRIHIEHRLSSAKADVVGLDRYGMLTGRHNRSWTLTHVRHPALVHTLCLSSGGRMRILQRSDCP